MSQESNNYRVALEVYTGPLDLLLYLIRREEVDIYDIPISRVTKQYCQYVEMLQHLDPDAVGQFLVFAATLMEIKSRMLLPTPPEEVAEEDAIDPRVDLVRQLLEYKRFKDVAGDLQTRADEFGRRFPRAPVIPDQDALDLEDAEVWDLMAAFNKLLQQIGRTGYQHQVIYDDTPIATHAISIIERLQKQGGSIEFTAIFGGKTRPQMVGAFLALLELIRRQRVRADQDRPFGQIYVFLLDSRPLAAPELAESFGPEGSKASGPLGMAARPPIETDSTQEPGDEPVAEATDGVDTEVREESIPGAEDDTARDRPETDRDGAEPA